MKLLFKTSLSPFKTKQKNELRTYFKSVNFFLFLGKRYFGALEFQVIREGHGSKCRWPVAVDHGSFSLSSLSISDHHSLVVWYPRKE